VGAIVGAAGRISLQAARKIPVVKVAITNKGKRFIWFPSFLRSELWLALKQVYIVNFKKNTLPQ
jgi:hypothetical protein